MSKMQINLKQTGGVKISFVEKDHHDNIFVKKLIEKSAFQGEKKDLFYHIKEDGTSELFVGLGEKNALEIDDLRQIGFNIIKTLKSQKEYDIEITAPKLAHLRDEEVFIAFAEGFLQGAYDFTKKTEDKEEEPFVINYTASDETVELHDALEEITTLLEGVYLARNLVNETANIIYPASLADVVLKELAPLGVSVDVYGKKEIQEIGMDAFLSVAQGSDKEAKLIVMNYHGDANHNHYTAFVGKGLTYDSGGYCIKPASGMVTMHSDMAGAASVIGAIYALAKNRIKTNVIGVVAACENLVSGKAYKTGDIIKSLSGKTIEVVNTDAEGRLTLADALYYASQKDEVEQVVDLATLTGACVVALGGEYTGAVTNNDDFYNKIDEAAKVSGEKIWKLPSDERFKEMNKSSKVADLNNSPGRDAGAITAGLFVGEFLAKDIPWIHLDIAGTSYLDKPKGYLPERATGIHVKTLYYLLKKTK